MFFCLKELQKLSFSTHFYVDFVIFCFISIPSKLAYSFISFQKCINGIGDFFCECAFGYKLDKIGNCKAESIHGKAILYFSGVTEIRSREISDNNHYTLITDDHSKVRQAIGEKYNLIHFDHRILEPVCCKKRQKKSQPRLVW